MNAFKDQLLSWPDAASIPIGSAGFRHYRTPDGNFPSVTTVLKAYGGGTEGLIRWSATEERKAVLEAASEVWAADESLNGGDEFTAAVEARLGSARQHQKKLAKAADIGTSIHAMIQWTLRRELGEDPGPQPVLSDPALVGFMSWQDWWRAKGRTPVRIEQPVWEPEIGYAGTVDLLAQGPDGLELWDWKSSAGIYESHHMQAAAYVYAANRWAPVIPGGIVKLPKSIDGDLAAREVPIGHLYDGRILSIGELVAAFTHTLGLWNTFMRPNNKEPR